ncbi:MULTISPECIES: GYDIA family GHMP kinase [unclassified Carboxylicivirga]|uniref:GYDIA family GHMP kinase n=1 Tax=Carboxylicivirga TaxID=1628153 RepID=UPI003D352525
MQQSKSEHYTAHGKLLITGEYLVLRGAKALAFPLKCGQELTVKPAADNFLSWEAISPQGQWLQASFDETLKVLQCNDEKLAQQLASILKKCIDYRPDIRKLLQNKAVTTSLDFKREWGWGSSSTLISLLAQWLGINPYLLLHDTFGGSGYDIACATASSPIIYQLKDGVPSHKSVGFDPTFARHIYFVYSGRKQSSQQAIARLNHQSISTAAINQVNAITEALLKTHSLHDFGYLMAEHEAIISKVVQLEPIKDEHFKDFRGYIKTLGAWGGDFVMAVSDEGDTYVRNYFNARQRDTIFKFNDLKI